MSGMDVYSLLPLEEESTGLTCNLGHVGIDTAGTWAINRPESVIDWGYRAWHGTTVLGKLLINEWYGTPSKYNYFYGCSTGGRQGMKDLQTYPDDYDGIIARAPAWWTTHQQLWNLKQTVYQAPADSAHTIPEKMFDLIAAEAIKQCDGQDGLVDSIISDPQDILGLGEDFTWEDLSYKTVELADRLNPGNATADKFDISDFYNRGGKFLHYHGMSDAYVSPDASIYYYHQASSAMKPQGVDMDDFYRLFLVPGMEHCLSTPDEVNAPWYFAGPDQAATINTGTYSTPGYRDAHHDIVLAMMAWVENGTVPNDIIATKWKNDTSASEVLRQRPICHYPYQAKHNGKDEPNDAASWSCETLF
ncbi:tannase and feruloyl esterase [Penicillium brevicompactum]|uniref:Carboxylic ester hydrolase n=1 Tax=Penicillium brevicompactum TaxID=5074 RepID=A0A9W9QZT0_PENBR|nr:tannase and feruloyl esterase [Penicillium brevicompactum]